MAERLILHIGPRKTGTTYLQELLWGNESRLEEQGFFLPLADHEAQLRAVTTEMGDRWRAEVDGNTWEALAAEVRGRAGTALVSSELLGSAAPRQIRNMVEAVAPVRVEVVLGARDVARQLPALWQQWVRAGATTTYAEWLDTARDNPAAPFWKTQDPSALVDRWSSVVRHEQICVVVVPPHGAPPLLLWERFAEAIGADPAQVSMPPAHSNNSLGTVQSELLRLVNAEVEGSFPSRHQETVLRRHLIDAALLGSPGTKITLLADHAGWADNGLGGQEVAPDGRGPGRPQGARDRGSGRAAHRQPRVRDGSRPDQRPAGRGGGARAGADAPRHGPAQRPARQTARQARRARRPAAAPQPQAQRTAEAGHGRAAPSSSTEPGRGRAAASPLAAPPRLDFAACSMTRSAPVGRRCAS